jgi:hypothetical protein
VESIWLWPLALAAALFALPALRDLAARLVATRYRSQVRERAPDFISLVSARDPRWRNSRAIAVADHELNAAGFEEAGTFLVHQMPELTVGLYAHSGECAYAVLYDHPTSGFWAELVTRYHDGSLANFTTLEPMDVEVPEGSVYVAAPGFSVAGLWQRMRTERPVKPMRECSHATAARDFERGYAESVARHRRAERVAPLVGAPTDLPIDRPVALPIAMQFEQLVTSPAEPLVVQSVEKSVESPTDQPSKPPIEPLVAQHAEEPADGTVPPKVAASGDPPDEEFREAA